MAAIRSISLVLLAVSISLATPASASVPDGSPLVVGSVLNYRYAIYNQDLLSDGQSNTQFGFLSCELLRVHGVEDDAFRVECEGGPTEDAAFGWGPWHETGYYAWREDGLHHVTSPSTSELSLSHALNAESWSPRSVLVLGEPVDARCPKIADPEPGQAVFEEICWTPEHGPVLFMGVDTSSGIAEASWELVHVKPAQVTSVSTISDANAQKLINDWLWTQNANRPKNYSWLYGMDFHGVERGAFGTGSFDRKDWLDSRQTLFRRKTRIRAMNMKILFAGDTAIALFEQQRTVGSRSDRGIRELRLGLERGRVVIVREEMLFALGL